MFVIFFSIFFLFGGNSLATDEVQDYYWRDYVPGDIPLDAVEAAPGVYIGQVYYQGHMVPAAILPHSLTAVTEFGSKIILKEVIKILCGQDQSKFYWEYVNFKDSHGDEMKNVIRGGFQIGLGNLYIGRILYESDWKIGRVVTAQHNAKGLYTWNKDGKQIRLYEFHLLKYMTRCT